MRLVHTVAMIGSPLLLLVAASLGTGQHGNPVARPKAAIQENLDVPAAVGALLRRSCFDCHSSQTRWPWYARVPGVGWILERDVAGGREAIDFSGWAEGAGKTPVQAGGVLLAACEAVRLRRMPKPNYLFLHPEARLAPADVETFCRWAHQQAAALIPEGDSR